MKISIVTPSFNQAQFIEDTIRSVVTQKGDFEIEYIIMDGGSTDGSVDIIKRYAKEYPWIIWFSKKDKGQSDAINQGFEMATGDVFAWLNSDDWYRPGTLQTVARYFSKYPKRQWAYGFVDIIDRDNRKMFSLAASYRNLMGRRFSRTKLLIENFIAQPATFWRRSFMEKVGPVNEDLHLAMDYELWLRMAKRSRPGVIRRVLTNFRRHAATKNGLGFNPKQFAEELQISKRYTKNPFIIGLHHLNILKIRLGYQLLVALHKGN